ncbi:MAG: dihydrofolate reductase family protein, partial [Natronosporangium sp.]
MRTLIYTAFVSLDGVVDSPGGEPGYRNSGWTFKDIEFIEDVYEIKGREQKEATAMMMGRVSYEAFAPVWPTMEEFADYKVMPK